jgi:peptide/nickel transport system substrate-binding protein
VKENSNLKRLLVIGLVLVMLLSVALTAQADSAQHSQAGPQIYREGFLAGCPLSSLNTGCAHRLDIYVNEPLIALTWQGGLQPMLAESYDMEEDGKVWIFHLRENAKWHDGVPFTADDVVFSLNAYADPAVTSRRHVWTDAIMGYDEFRNGEADSLSGVTALDEHTVRVELATAAPLWIKIQLPYLVMFPEHILGSVPRDELINDSYWENRIGTGPFKWADYAPDQYIELVRNDDWYLGTPKLDKIILQMYSDGASQVAALERGELDTTAYETTLIGMDDVERIDALDGIDVVVMDKGSSAFIRFNHNDPLFADKRVRQAFRYAIDVDTLMETVYVGGRPAYTMYPQPWTWPEGMNTYPYNPDKARELLNEAGWPSGREVDFIYYFTDSLSADLVVAMQAYLADVGINIKPRLVDSAVQMDLLSNNTLETGLFGMGMGVDPSIGNGNLQCGAMLAQGYCNPALDELFAKGAALSDPDERAQVYQEISMILNEELPDVWLWYDLRPLGFNRRVVGPYEHYSEQGTIYFNVPVYNEIEDWYIAG